MRKKVFDVCESRTNGDVFIGPHHLRATEKSCLRMAPGGTLLISNSPLCKANGYGFYFARVSATVLRASTS